MVKASDKKPDPKETDIEKREKRPKAIEIVSVWRTRKRIIIDYMKGDNEFKEKSRDNPRKVFDDNLDALIPVVCSICSFPKNYDEGLRIMGFKLSEKKGAQSVTIFARKDLPEAASEFPIDTPPRLLEHPKTPGSYTAALPKEYVELVREAITAAKDYARGDRAQGQLSLEDEEDEEGEGHEDGDKTAPLPFNNK